MTFLLHVSKEKKHFLSESFENDRIPVTIVIDSICHYRWWIYHVSNVPTLVNSKWPRQNEARLMLRVRSRRENEANAEYFIFMIEKRIDFSRANMRNDEIHSIVWIEINMTLWINDRIVYHTDTHDDIFRIIKIQLRNKMYNFMNTRLITMASDWNHSNWSETWCYRTDSKRWISLNHFYG